MRRAGSRYGEDRNGGKKERRYERNGSGQGDGVDEAEEKRP